MRKIQFRDKALLTALFIVGFFGCFAQTDFNNYKTIVAKGPIPDDFTTATYQKIANDRGTRRDDLSARKESVFLEGIHYSIDEILHSGLVVYGDEVTRYVTDVATRLLKSRPELQGKLRFYTIKSNETNAFSTDQGIMFVTTGLIAQITSEAQLALVLAHEISHYLEKHVLETYNLKLESRNYSKRIKEMSRYSKEKEFEADVKGLELYHAAGYPKGEILPTFDVLMYSYLPFDEVAFPTTYFNSDLLFIPELKFPATKYPIKAVEDEDDSKSSHPNVKSRKEKMSDAIATYAQWGTDPNPLTLDRFNEIRLICRFESVRTDLNDMKFADALYSVFLLEQDFPNSMYLHRMKAKIWLGIAQHRLAGSLTKHLWKTSELEGEVAAVHFLLKELKKEETSTIALRIIYDLKRRFPDDREIAAVYDRTVQTFAETEKLVLGSFSTMNYQTALAKSTEGSDSTQVAPETQKGESKYEKIKGKKNMEDPKGFQEGNYYLYALSDLIQDELFLKTHAEKKAAIDQRKQEKKDRDNMTRSERKKARKKEMDQALHLGESTLVFVEPIVRKEKRNSIDEVKSEKLEELYVEALKQNATELEMSATVLSATTLREHGTVGYNERAILFNYLGQISENDEVDVFPVDFDLLDEIKNNYGTDKVVFSLLEHRYDASGLAYSLIYGIFIPPILAIAVPYILISAPQTELNVVVMDLTKGQIVKANELRFSNSLNKIAIQAYVYEILSQLKTMPK